MTKHINWIPVEEHLPDANLKETFIAVWVYDGYMDGIEWYAATGDDYRYMNLNSHNMNEFMDEHGKVTHHHMFTHWALYSDFNFPDRHHTEPPKAESHRKEVFFDPEDGTWD